MASALPIWQAASILAHPERFPWQITEDGSPVYIHRVENKGVMHFWACGDSELPAPVLSSGEDALATLKTFDIQASCLHLLYAACATELKRPWEEECVISGRQIADYLGLTHRKDITQQDKLDLILHLAPQPARLQVHVDWPAIGKRESFTIERSRLWEIKIGCQNHTAPPGRGVLDELRIHVRPGPWAQYFLNRQGQKEGCAFYQYGFLSQPLLKAMMGSWQKHPGAVRLMIWLLFKSRVDMGGLNKVASLLEVAYGPDVLNQARGDRRRRSELVRRWDNDLLILHEHGATIAFDPKTYPASLQPDWATDRSPHMLKRPFHYFDSLLRAKCGIRPPVDIETELLAITLRKAGRRKPPVKRPPLIQGDIHAARLALGWKQADLARAMGKAR
jgi:hypothetical protein